MTATAQPVILSGLVGVYGPIVNGLYTPTSTMNCGMPVYFKKLGASPLDSPIRQDKKAKSVKPVPTVLVYEDPHSSGHKNKTGGACGVWMVRTLTGKVYARAVLPPEAPPCFPQELYMSPDGKYRRSDVVWEMKSSVRMFGFRARPAGAVQIAPDLMSQETARSVASADAAVSREEAKGSLKVRAWCSVIVPMIVLTDDDGACCGGVVDDSPARQRCAA